jgi:UDP-N-acetylglucosamine diphosphorylase/glucosamine-1-phosphate N-acetyltransferase
MRIIIYEDRHENFFPLINFYPQFNLRIGTQTIAEHIARHFQKYKFDFIARDIFKFKVSQRNEPSIYLSSRFLLKEKIQLGYNDMKFVSGGEDVGFLKATAPFPDNFHDIASALKHIKRAREVSGTVINHLWDIIKHNETAITDDFRTPGTESKIPKTLELAGKKSNLFIARDAVLHKFVFVDVTEGPVTIGKKAEIKPFSTIVGPAYIGEGTVIDRAKIIKSSIGPYCRVGGEVEATVFQGFSNKYHEGFIGHSVIGEWVNLGSLTTNSDLKNNYGTVRIRIGEREHDSKMTKLGCFIADHTKLGIGTLIPTGCVVGSFVNYFGGGTMPRYVPSFKWLGPDKTEVYDLERAIETARVVMKRRGITLTREYENLIRENHKYLLKHV